MSSQDVIVDAGILPAAGSVWVDPDAPRSQMVRMAVVDAFTAGGRIWLIVLVPIAFGRDSVTRLLHRDRVLMAHQQPMLQLLLHLLNLLACPRVPGDSTGSSLERFLPPVLVPRSGAAA